MSWWTLPLVCLAGAFWVWWRYHDAGGWYGAAVVSAGLFCTGIVLALLVGIARAVA